MAMAMRILLVLLSICLSQHDVVQLAQLVAQQLPTTGGRDRGHDLGSHADVGTIVQASASRSWSWSRSWPCSRSRSRSWWNFQPATSRARDRKEGNTRRLVRDSDWTGQERMKTVAGSVHSVSGGCRSAGTILPGTTRGADDRGKIRRRRVLLQDSRESDTKVVRVNDEQSLANAVSMTFSEQNATSSVKILVEKDIKLQNRSSLIWVNLLGNTSRDINLTMVGNCGNRTRCILDGRNKSGSVGDTFPFYFSRLNWTGSFAMYDLEFRDIHFSFSGASVELFNCVIRGGQMYFSFDESLVDTSYGSKRVVIDGCFIIENAIGVTMNGLAPNTCISRSVFVSGGKPPPSIFPFALSVVSSDVLVEKKLTVINCTFGNSSMGAGNSMGAVKVDLTAPVLDSTVYPKNTTVSFIDCTFSENAPSGQTFVDIQFGFAGSRSEGMWSVPFWNVQFCKVRVEIPFSGASNTAGRIGLNHSVAEYRSNGRLLAVQQCASKLMRRKNETDRDYTQEIRNNFSVNDTGLNIPEAYVAVVNDSIDCGDCGQSTVCNSNGPIFPLEPNATAAGSSRVPELAIVIPAVAFSILVVVAVLAGAAVFVWRRGYGRSFQKLDTLPEELNHLRLFALKDLTEATGNFSTIIGQGGGAVVYKATLRSGEVVAVKSLKAEYWRSADEFLREVKVLGKISHRNLVPLLGFCSEEKRYFLVYEFIPNGTLKDHLHPRPQLSGTDLTTAFLNWPTRVRIALEVARALEYLHHSQSPPLVHRDIKPENVLLLDDFTPKVAGFGPCRSIQPEGDTVLTKPAGTRGYMAPEIFTGKGLTEKVDVYSYGVLLLEIVTGRQPFATDFSLIDWVKSLQIGNEESEKGFADPKLRGEFSSSQLSSMTVLAGRCILAGYQLRPSMQSIVGELEIIQEGSSGIQMGSTEYQTKGTELPSRLYIPRGERHHDIVTVVPPQKASDRV